MNLGNDVYLSGFSITTMTLVTARINTGRTEQNSYSRVFQIQCSQIRSANEVHLPQSLVNLHYINYSQHENGTALMPCWLYFLYSSNKDIS